MTPSRPRRSDIVTPEAVVLDLEVAGLASRALARALDTVIEAAVLFAFFLAMVLAANTVQGLLSGWVVYAVIIVVVALVLFGYPVLFELTRGRTPGKAALGLRVVSADGSPVTATASFTRSALQLVEFLLVPGGLLAVVTALASPRNQRLGDIVAGTLVLRERTALGLSQAVAFPPPRGLEAYVASLDTSRLDAEQYQVVRTFLLRVGDLHASAREDLARRLGTATVGVLGMAAPRELPPEIFLVCVASAYQQRGGGPW
ncbi:MAG: RDD family protein [Acidimicrobiia bacterium]